MRARVESPFTILAGQFKPARTRRIAAVGHNVHWYQFPQHDIDLFLRSLYYDCQYHYHAEIHSGLQYYWYCDITLYYRGTTVMLNLAYSRLYHATEYRLQYREALNSSFGFYPSSIEFWEFDSDNGFYMCQDIRKILNRIIKGVAK